MAIVALAAHTVPHAAGLSPAVALPLCSGMLVGYSVLSAVPCVLLAAPDESAAFAALPGQKLLLRGRGYEATMLTALGALAGLLLLVFVMGPLAPRILPGLYGVLRPHFHWMLWCVICFMVMSEWPGRTLRGQAGWRMLCAAWRPLAVGILTFALSGVLGFILFYRSPIGVKASFQNLMPAFVGLFTVPWLVMNLAAGTEAPAQNLSWGGGPSVAEMGKGILAGSLGGAFAAFVPAVTGGVGGYLAGHATALRSDRTFLISQGASKLTYYVGGFLLLSVPGLHVTRGGGAWLLRGFYVPYREHEYYMVLASIAGAGAISCLLVGPLARAVIAVIVAAGYRRVSSAALALTVSLVFVLTGASGLCVMAVAAGIGLLPSLYGTRRMYCLGVILLPLACNMSGFGTAVAGLLGLL